MPSRISFKPSPITLGTVQLGMRYGVLNATGAPSETAVLETLDTALASGITTFDTARAYGLAEERIGRWLAARKPRGIHVITKIPAIPEGAKTAPRTFVREQVAASIVALGIKPLPLVMVHEERDLLDSAVVDELQHCVARGDIEAFGASVYDVAVAQRLIATTPAAALQIPASIADRRFLEADIPRTAADRGIAVFVRSVFLQGILLTAPDRLPPHLRAFSPLLAAMAEAAQATGRSRVELLIDAVRNIPGISSIVIGVDVPGQIEASAKAALASPIPDEVRSALLRAAEALPRDIIVPSNWSRLAKSV